MHGLGPLLATIGLGVGLRSLRRATGKLDALLETKWHERLHLMRTQFDSFSHKQLPGSHQFQLQYSPQHSALKRPSSMATVAAVPVVQPFDPKRFHFGKADAAEIMCWLVYDSESGAVSAVSDWPPDPLLEVHPVFINISPLAQLHMLFPWFIDDCQPQVLNHKAVRRALAVSAASDKNTFKLVFNSLGAWASQNHLHWHGLHSQQPKLPIEMATQRPIASRGEVQLCVTVDYPVPTLVLRSTCQNQLAKVMPVAAEVMG